MPSRQDTHTIGLMIPTLLANDLEDGETPDGRV